jgi:hypothetical protein
LKLKAGVLSRFKLVLPKTTFLDTREDQVFTGISIDDCANRCIEKLGAECKTFDYCVIAGECRLSDYPAPSPDDTVEIRADEYCDIYESKFFKKNS